MKKRLLLEVIYNEILSEGIGAGLVDILKKLGRTFNDEFFRSLGKDAAELARMKPNEISKLIKDSVEPSIVSMRKEMANYLIDTKFRDIDGILKKYDLTIAEQAKMAGKELSEKLGIEPGILRDVKKAWELKKGVKSVTDVAGAAATASANATVTATLPIIQEALTASKVKWIIDSFATKFPTEFAKTFKDKMLFRAPKNIQRLREEVISKMAGKNYDEIVEMTLQTLERDSKGTIKGAKAQTATELKGYRKNKGKGWSLSDITGLTKLVFWTALIGFGGYFGYKGVQAAKGVWNDFTNPGESDKLKKYLPGGVDDMLNGTPTDTTNTNQGVKPSKSVIGNLDLE